MPPSPLSTSDSHGPLRMYLKARLAPPDHQGLPLPLGFVTSVSVIILTPKPCLSVSFQGNSEVAQPLAFQDVNLNARSLIYQYNLLMVVPILVFCLHMFVSFWGTSHLTSLSKPFSKPPWWIIS